MQNSNISTLQSQQCLCKTLYYDLFKYDLLTLEHYLSKRVRRFDPSSTDLDHVLVSRVLPCGAMNNILYYDVTVDLINHLYIKVLR